MIKKNFTYGCTKQSQHTYITELKAFLLCIPYYLSSVKYDIFFSLLNMGSSEIATDLSTTFYLIQKKVNIFNILLFSLIFRNYFYYNEYQCGVNLKLTHISATSAVPIIYIYILYI